MELNETIHFLLLKMDLCYEKYAIENTIYVCYKELFVEKRIEHAKGVDYTLSLYEHVSRHCANYNRKDFIFMTMKKYPENTYYKYKYLLDEDCRDNPIWDYVVEPLFNDVVDYNWITRTEINFRSYFAKVYRIYLGDKVIEKFIPDIQGCDLI